MLKSSLKRNSEKLVQRITGVGGSVNSQSPLSNQTTTSVIDDENSKLTMQRYSVNGIEMDEDSINDENDCYSANKVN
jgi:hypothetical protein